MIIENQWQKFYVPDEIGNNKELSVSDVFASAIPYDEYIQQENLDANKKKLAEINSELLDLEKEPDEILVPNDVKIGRVMELEEEKEKLILLIK